MDRLTELRSAGHVELELDDVTPQGKTNQFFNSVSNVQGYLTTIETNVQRIEETYGRHIASVTDQDSQQFRGLIDRYVEETTNAATQAKAGLDALEQQVKRFDGSPSEKSLQSNMLNGLKRQFIDHMKAFREIQTKYKSKYKEKIVRQVKIVHPDMPDEEVEELVESNQAEKIFEQGILDQRSREAQVALNYLKDRQDDLQKLEESIIQLQELFRDVALLVDSQGELLDQIEHTVNQAGDHIEAAAIETRTAVVYQNRNRKLKAAIICAVILGGIAIALIILFMVLQVVKV